MTAPVNEEGGPVVVVQLRRSSGGLFEEMGGFDEGFPYPYFDLEDVDFRLRLDDRGEKRYPFVPAAAVDHPPRPVAPLHQRRAFAGGGVVTWRASAGSPVARIGPRPDDVPADLRSTGCAGSAARKIFSG